MKLKLTLWLAALSALAAAADPGGGPPPSAGPAGPIATQTRGDQDPLLGRDLLDESAVPVISPSIVDEDSARARPPRIPEGTTIFDRRASLRRGPAGKWWTISDPRVDRLYLLPCELLETVEDVCGDRPAAMFELSGEVYHYRGEYYLMLRRVLEVDPASPPGNQQKPATPDRQPAGDATTSPDRKPAESGTTSRDRKGADDATTTKPADAGPSAEDVAATLLKEVGGRPVLAPKRPLGRAEVVASVAPPANPLPPGPGRMVVNRLARLRPSNQTWPLVVFEADNTLREPPLPVLPNEHLAKMERLSDGGAAAGAIFHVSGEIHQYRGRQYLLLRNVLLKRDLDQF